MSRQRTPGSPLDRRRRPSQRQDTPQKYRWDLSHIFPSWDAWRQCCAAFEKRLSQYAELRGRLADGAGQLLRALELDDELGRLASKIWYYPSLMHDQDQRDNAVEARRQEAQALFARWQQTTSWFAPELLRIPAETVDEWMEHGSALALYRFKLRDLYRRREHVLGDEGEHILSLASRLEELPEDAYSALSVADMTFPRIRLSTGEEVTLTYGRYRAILATDREQANRASAFQAFHDAFGATSNTFAALYGGVCQRDWFTAQARRYDSTLAAALDGNHIPRAVVENLIATTREGVAPLRRYHRLRSQVLGLDSYHLYDAAIPLVEKDYRYPYDEGTAWIEASVAALGPAYQAEMRRALHGSWIDAFENEGKRSGAYSAGVYGVHPYVLLNYNDTLDDLFTVAHELGHTLHTVLSHRRQPFVYAAYTIFVAEVASTLAEGLLLDFLLQRSVDLGERVTLLQHAIDGILGTFYTQVLFADWELRAHSMVERGEPLTGEILSELYHALLTEYYGDSVDLDDAYRITWARIPHFFRSPYYVFQYATSWAASSQLLKEIRTTSGSALQEVIDRYLTLLASGGNAYPIDQLRCAGVDLAEPAPVQAVVHLLDDLVSRLELDLLELGRGALSDPAAR